MYSKGFISKINHSVFSWIGDFILNIFLLNLMSDRLLKLWS